MKSSIDSGKHKFHHHKPSEHTWQPSMRESVSVIDLDLQKATNGQFTGHHFIKNGKIDRFSNCNFIKKRKDRFSHCNFEKRKVNFLHNATSFTFIHKE